MEIIDSLTFALREIIAGKRGFIPRTQYQCAHEVAPDLPFYVRESIIPMTPATVNQSGMRYDFIAQYDLFARKDAFPDPVRKLHEAAGEFAAAFSPPEMPFGKHIGLTGWSRIETFISAPVDVQGMNERDNFFQLPVLVNVTVIADASATFTKLGAS